MLRDNKQLESHQCENKHFYECISLHPCAVVPLGNYDLWVNLEKLWRIGWKGELQCQNTSRPWKWKPRENSLCTVGLQRTQGLLFPPSNTGETPVRATNLTDFHFCICSLTNPTGLKLPRSIAEALPDRLHANVTNTSQAIAEECSQCCRHTRGKKRSSKTPRRSPHGNTSWMRNSIVWKHSQ